MRLLVLDAYAPEGREALDRAGATRAGELYERMLRRLVPAAQIDVVQPADGEIVWPDTAGLEAYDGLAWTGSSLTILAGEGDPRVARQVALARAAFESGIPSFGSCWAAQLACVAAGGRCEANPRGREFGISRKIVLSRAGQDHPLFAGKPTVFDAFTSHADHVKRLPARTESLASNGFCLVQAVAVRHARGSFWAVQYHPEYDLHEVARLAVVRADDLIAQGSFASRTDLDRWVDELETLHADPTRRDLAFRLGIDDDLLDPARRQREVRNWLDYAVERRRPTPPGVP